MNHGKFVGETCIAANLSHYRPTGKPQLQKFKKMALDIKSRQDEHSGTRKPRLTLTSSKRGGSVRHEASHIFSHAGHGRVLRGPVFPHHIM